MNKDVVECGEFFPRHELACKCGCGQALMDREFVALLDKLRGEMGVPLFPSSGYRCPNHNERESPKTGRTGPHTTGHAVDISISAEYAHNLIGWAVSLGFTGIGVKQHGAYSGRFIHLDDLPRGDRQPRPHIWSYP